MSLKDFTYESYGSPTPPSQFADIFPSTHTYTPPFLSEEGIFLKERGGIYAYGLKRRIAEAR